MTTDRPSPVVVLAAGGTGGHVFPAEALAAALIARGAKPVLITDRRGGNFGGVLGGLDLYTLRAGALTGVSRSVRLRNIFALALGFGQALSQLSRLRPQAVVGFGGYASVPTVLAAGIRGYRTVIHEQNAVLGRANRMLAKRVGHIATAFEQVDRVPAAAADRLIRTGMPVRPAFVTARAQAFRCAEGDEPFRLLILGGSQGAQVLSEVVPAAAGLLPPEFRQRLRISQQCRKENLADVRLAYERTGIAADLETFFQDVPQRLAAAHLVIARSGASTVAEIAAVGRPSVLIPYPFAADDHQSANARAMVDWGAAVMFHRGEFTPAALAGRIVELTRQPGRLAKMAERAAAFAIPDAGDRLADLVMGIGAGTQAGGGKERAA
jgi:UDP-N-acetylglucosamine--N-acetylmuramyl-(pentapeptide) pyrophosphoryl-undecaprenol N-acetylglucosamine transferase